MSDDADLKALEREVEKLRSSRRDTAAVTVNKSEDKPQDKSKRADSSDIVVPPVVESGIEGAVAESERVIHDLALQLEAVVGEMEDAARERPALALLTAFAVGVAVGKLFSRG